MIKYSKDEQLQACGFVFNKKQIHACMKGFSSWSTNRVFRPKDRDDSMMSVGLDYYNHGMEDVCYNGNVKN